jgi:hypothetical protein
MSIMGVGTDCRKGKVYMAGDGAEDGTARSIQAGGSDAEEWQAAITWSYNFDDHGEVRLEL